MQSSVYNPFFTPMRYSPALWLDASDQSTLVMDGARTLNGSTQYFSLASNSTLQTGNVDSWFSVWVYLTATSASYRTIIAKCNNPSSQDLEYLISKDNTNKIYFLVDYRQALGNQACVVTEPTTLSVGTWYFVFAYFDSVNQIAKIALNGNAFTASSVAIRTPVTTTQNLGVGAYVSNSNHWPGSIDSLCFGKPASGWLASNATALRDYLYNGGSGRRSSDFLASAYYTGGNPSGAVSWWDMDARSGNETDRIGSNNLTDNGGVGYAAGVASGLVQYTGDPVKQWSDKSGNARHATAASDAGRPTYTTGVQNGLAGVAGDGVDDALKTGFVFDLATSKTLTMIGVVKAGARLLGSFWRSGYQDYYTGMVFNQNQVTVGVGLNPPATYKVYDVAGLDNAMHIFSVQASTSNLALWQDGVAKTLTVNSGTMLLADWLSAGSGLHAFSLFGRTGGTSGYYQSTNCEVLVFPSTLTDAQRQQVERYLGNKWGIAVS